MTQANRITSCRPHAPNARKVKATSVIADELTAVLQLHPLRRGFTCTVSPCDLDLLMAHEWIVCRANPFSPWYAVTILPNGQQVRMHRLLLGLDTGDERLGDHRNGNQLDNRRENLRIATHAQNARNRRVIENRSGFKGVFRSSARRWGAKLKGRRLGTFATPEEAGAAYDAAARSNYGEFAATNAELRAGLT
jgi:hypothetical protein